MWFLIELTPWVALVVMEISQHVWGEPMWAWVVHGLLAAVGWNVALMLGWVLWSIVSNWGAL